MKQRDWLRFSMIYMREIVEKILGRGGSRVIGGEKGQMYYAKGNGRRARLDPIWIQIKLFGVNEKKIWKT